MCVREGEKTDLAMFVLNRMGKLREEQEKLEMTVAQLESTIKTQGNQLISSDIRGKSLNMQLTVETSSKETLQETLKAKETHIEGLEEKVRLESFLKNCLI